MKKILTLVFILIGCTAAQAAKRDVVLGPQHGHATAEELGLTADDVVTERSFIDILGSIQKAALANDVAGLGVACGEFMATGIMDQDSGLYSVLATIPTTDVFRDVRHHLERFISGYQEELCRGTALVYEAPHVKDGVGFGGYYGERNQDFEDGADDLMTDCE